MNLKLPLSILPILLFRFALKCRNIFSKQKSIAFGLYAKNRSPKIEHIYVINLDRHSTRWVDIQHELKHILDWTGKEIIKLSERYSAVDASNIIQEQIVNEEIITIYTLGDQLFVEPQPNILPTKLILDSPIKMSWQEIAIAKSHINLWKRIAQSKQEYVLILEDDVWFRPEFANSIDIAWQELTVETVKETAFDILYLSYEEVKHGAPKEVISNNIFRPIRGLWHLSGYVLSRRGAQKLLNYLPCKGPIDLWINFKYEMLDVRAIKSSIISQRRDVSSSNSYSILPTLTKIGVINSEAAALFHIRPSERPVFAFGSEKSGLTSLAMALSMLGYRCCNDIQKLPDIEQSKLLSGDKDLVFDAYVNVEYLNSEISNLRMHYPLAKIFICRNKNEKIDSKILKVIKELDGFDVEYLDVQEIHKWKVICEHLRCAPPISKYPELEDLGIRQTLQENRISINKYKIPKRDKSPWIIDRKRDWNGIQLKPTVLNETTNIKPIKFIDTFEIIDADRWYLRDDTFTDNIALFRPTNVKPCKNTGISLYIKKEILGVREYSAAAISSCDKYLYGKFEAVIKPSNSPGVITGLFLHRDSPRQEIDIEISGKNTHHILLNVFYNPGSDGVKYDYGYRGASSIIDLGFDAFKEAHIYTIEWSPNEIRWLVDNKLIHKRVEWDPTPIPSLPMVLHCNTWPCRSIEIAGRLNDRSLPTSSIISSISVEANHYNNLLQK